MKTYENLMEKLSLKILIVFSISLSFFGLSIDAANILAIFPSVWKSHYIFGRNLINHLVETNPNHRVTIISPYGEEAKNEQIEEIRVNGLIQNWKEMGFSFDIESMRKKSSMERFTSLMYAGTSNVDLLLQQSNGHLLLKDKKHFDLIIVDLFLSEALLGFSYFYNAPTVVLSPIGSNTWLNYLTGNPQSFAYDPSNFLTYTERMDLWQRCLNTLMGTFEKLTYNFFLMISQQAIYEKHFQFLSDVANISLPHHRDLATNVSLVLLNSNAIVQYPRANLPNMLSVAGMHLSHSSNHSLPKHLESFIESSKLYTVYISFGANVQMEGIPIEKLNIFLDIFETLSDVNFLLKCEPEFSEKHKFPENVMVSEWFPQDAILAHPKVKLFISSCGLMSVIESIYYEKPILAIPIYSEQMVTAKRLESHGVSLIIEYEDFAYDSMLYNIKKLANDKYFAEQMKHLKEFLNYDIVLPIDKTMHYIEMILKTNGASFLKSHANKFNFIRSELLDVALIIVFGMMFIIAIPFLITCCILRKSYNQTSSEKTQATQTTNSQKTLLRSNSYACVQESRRQQLPTPSVTRLKSNLSATALLESLDLVPKKIGQAPAISDTS